MLSGYVHKMITHQVIILMIAAAYSTVTSLSCKKFEDRSSVCFGYVNDYVYDHNQSNQINNALANVINTVNGSYCRQRATEFLCNYYFPHCENDTSIVPICNESCTEYLLAGICATDIINTIDLLNELNDEGYHNVSVNEYDCSPPYNVTLSNNCANLTGVPSAESHVQCVPLSTGGFCDLVINNYAIEVAQDKQIITIADVFRNASSAVLNDSDSEIDPICITLLDLISCFYKFPPCLDFKLLLPCDSFCVNIVEYYTLCFAQVAKHIRNKVVQDHFILFNCREAESYYIGLDEGLFQLDDESCLKIPDEIWPTAVSPNVTTGNDTIEVTDAFESSGVTNTAIIIAVSGSCVVIFIVIVLLLAIYMYTRRKKKTNNSLPVNSLDKQVPNSPTIVVASDVFYEFEKAFAGQIINPDDLLIKEKIGEGAFGIVHRGFYSNETGAIDVAIKTLRAVDTSKTEQFIKECIMAKRFNHPNILNLIGVSYAKEEGIPLMILPFMHNGDVKSFVKSKRGNTLEVTEFPEGLDHNLLERICLDIAKGMEYLSSFRCVHRDLAARNCMLDENMIAKVADFGLTRDIYIADYYRIGHDTPLPVKWMAPESLIDKLFTTESDVWSFGVTCWEIFTLGLQPYPTVDEYDMVDYLKAGNTLDKPILSSDKMYEIMKSCWTFVPEDRMTFCLLVKKLNQLHSVESESPVE